VNSSLEPLGRKSDWVSLTAVFCGLAPLPFGLLSLVPLVGCLSTPFLLLAIPSAIGFGVAGIVRARSQPEPNYILPVTGLVLGVSWVLLGGGLALYLSRGAGKALAEKLVGD
jgi:hypothetical protein